MTAMYPKEDSQDENCKDDVPSYQDKDRRTAHTQVLQSGPDPSHEYLSGLNLVAMLAAVVFPYFLVMYDASTVSMSAPQIITTFNSLLDVGWYGAAYELTSSASQPPSGKIYTKFSLRVRPGSIECVRLLV